MYENSLQATKPERRKENRYPVVVDIVIFSGKNFFRTKTLDISANGCKLLNPIPEHFLKDNLEVIISGSDDGRQSFQIVTGSMVGESRARMALKTNFMCSPV